MRSELLAFFSIFTGLLVAAGLLHLLPRLGQVGQRLTEACCRVPLLDLLVFYFTVLPLLVGPLIAGWFGLLSAILAQLVTLLTWQTIHEALHSEAMKGPRIIKVLNQSLALFVTSPPSMSPVSPYPSFGLFAWPN
jgi:hypothetical protein